MAGRWCVSCGQRVDDEYVAVRMVDESAEYVKRGGGRAHKRRSAKTLMHANLCPTCAVAVADAIYERIGR